MAVAEPQPQIHPHLRPARDSGDQQDHIGGFTPRRMQSLTRTVWSAVSHWLSSIVVSPR
jgi:hypothetical protein